MKFILQAGVRAPACFFYAFSANFRNGLNKSMGIGNTVVELFSAAI
jgi:hypothetical protein